MNSERIGFNTEPTPEQPRIDKGAILDALLDEAGKEFGIDVTEEDVVWLRDEVLASDADHEFLDWLMSLAWSNGVDHEELLERLGVSLELDEKTE
jgi:methionine salvage enolase-phosphatase E1